MNETPLSESFFINPWEESRSVSLWMKVGYGSEMERVLLR
jgi:hypothetical protein